MLCIPFRCDIAFMSFFHKITHSSRITCHKSAKTISHFTQATVSYGSTNAALPRAIRLCNSVPHHIASQLHVSYT